MAGEVTVRQEPLTIPTYPVGEPERCPIFYSGRGYQGAKGPVYPYPLLDRLSDVREDRTYQAVYLENPYVQLCVLPEIGGRIFWGLDKTNGYDFVYRQHVIKPALIGMLGAWISGGVEWDIPHHHRPTTFMPVDWHVVADEDGARTLWLGEIERRHRMKWIVGLTLYPNRSYLEVTIRLFNRTPYAQSFLCFTNLAVHVNDDYQVIFPPDTQWGTQHAKCEFVRWPIADGVYGGVDYTGVDVSWWRNHPSPLSIFAFDSREDFFGGYDHGRQAGVVHVADHHAVPGKKFFTFGNGPAGRTWDKILTDSDGPYLELMAGAYSDNQPDYSWIQPYETKTIREYWYPVRDLGGFKNANRDAAVNLDVDARGTCRLAFNTTQDTDAATVLLRAGEKILLREQVRIGPASPFHKELPLPKGIRAPDLHASVLLPTGDELISYRPDLRRVAPMPQPVEPPPDPDKIAGNEGLYLAGLRLEQFHSPAAEPEPYYREALNRDPGDVRANTALGILYCKRGMFEQAEQLLRRAVERLTRNYTRPRDGEPLYYLGVAFKAQGKTAEARDWLQRAAWSHAWQAASWQILAEMACREGDRAEAMACIDRCLACDVFNTRARNVKTVLLRLAQRFDEALAMASGTLKIDPLDVWAWNERSCVHLGMQQYDQSRQEREQLGDLMRDPQAWLELSCDYQACGLWDEAASLIDTLVGPAAPNAALDAMFHYAAGYCHDMRGGEQAASSEYRVAAGRPPEGWFPFRIESAGWLRAAIARNPTDGRADYYLGNLLYDLQPQEAIRAWERSRQLDDTFWLTHRNLGFAYGRTDKDRSRAIASYKRAIECNGREPRLFLELDQLLEAAGAPASERLSLLERNHDVVRQRGDALLRQIPLHVLLGQYDRAIELLDSRHFHIWEGGEHTVHDVYVDAHLLKGRSLSAASRHRQALAEYLLAAEYPDRFEVGEPYDGGRAAQVWYHVGLAREALGETDQARVAFERAARQARPGTDLPYYRGLAWRKLGQEAKALACFNEVEQLGRDMLSGAARDFFEKFGVRRSESDRQAHAHYLLGCGALGKGDASTARREFEQALRLNPNHLWARTLLAGL